MERISTIEGDASIHPVIIVAPHGADDPRSGELAKKIAEDELGCYCVINNGWERGDSYIYNQEKCNCNSIAQLLDDSDGPNVARAEFLTPILRFVSQIQSENTTGECQIFIIHGFNANQCFPLNTTGAPETILGYGEGDPPSYTADLDGRVWPFAYLCSKSFHTYLGASGGLFSGRRRKNLNQLYRKWNNVVTFAGGNDGSSVHSIQIEIERTLRDANTIDTTAQMLASVIDEFVNFTLRAAKDDSISKIPKDFAPNWKDVAKNLPTI